jgi:long-chain acyl-CoA synthetase
MKVQTKTGLEWLTLPFVLRSNARRNPEKEAVVDYTYNKRFTYHEAWLRSNKVANALADLRIKDGDRVAYLSHNTEECFHLVFGAAAISAILVPLNFRQETEVWIRQVNHSGATTVVCQDKYCEAIDAGRAGMPHVRNYIGFGKHVPPNWIDFEDLLGKASDMEPSLEAKHNDICFFLYTSGTTGDPKGCIRTHSSLIGFALTSVLLQRAGRDNKTWFLHDMIHIGGLCYVVHAMLAGGTLCLTEVFNAKESWELIHKEKVNDIYPTMVGIYMWLNMPDRPAHDMKHVKSVWWGAQPPYNAWLAGKKMFPDAIHNYTFGATEGMYAMCDEHEDLKNVKPEEWEGYGVGKVLEGVASFGHETMVTDLDLTEEVPDGEYGVIWARGMGCFDGFNNAPELEKKLTKPGGWVTSEDAGFIDGNTHMLYFVDRVKDVIKSGGENVPTSDVERVVMENPKVAVCAVIGTPHEKLGETVTAIIELKPGETMTAEELMESSNAELSGFKRVRRVEFVEKMPITGWKQQIDKKLLRETYTKKYRLS